MKNLNQIKRLAMLALATCLMLFACEDFADETFELSDVDAAAISAIEDTLEVNLPMKRGTILNDGTQMGVILLGGGRDTVIMAVDTAGITKEDMSFAMNAANIPGFSANDTAYAVTIYDDSLAYHILDIESAGTYVVYVDHHIAINVYEGAALDLVEFVSDDMAPELIAGHYSEGLSPTIKARYEYELSAGEYLFEIARVEATTNTNFRVVLIRE